MKYVKVEKNPAETQKEGLSWTLYPPLMDASNKTSPNSVFPRDWWQDPVQDGPSPTGTSGSDCSWSLNGKKISCYPAMPKDMAKMTLHEIANLEKKVFNSRFLIELIEIMEKKVF